MKQNTMAPKVSPDYPAAHSMDTHWFAIDEAGEVAMFDTHETGPVPVGPKAVDGIGTLPAFLNRDEYGIPVLAAVGDPLSAGEVARDVDRILSKLNDKERATLDQLVADRGLSEAQTTELKRSLRVTSAWGAYVELVDAADSLDFSRDDGVIRIDETRPIYHLLEGTALASALCLVLKQRVSAWRWMTAAEYEKLAVDVYGMYAFEQVDQAHDFHEYLVAPGSPPPYERRNAPRVPRHGLATGAASADHVAPVYALPGVSFAGSERVQVSDSIPCDTWHEGQLTPTQGEVRVRQYLLAFYEAEQSVRETLIGGLRLSAAQGDLIAQHVLGCLYGRSDMMQLEESARWFEAAARQAEFLAGGDQDKFGQGLVAQYCLADAYERGRGVAQDESMAIHWLERAADGGLDVALFQLGLRYKAGRGVAVDGLKAHRLLRAAAAQGHREASWTLRNYPDFEGANAGDAEAQCELAEMYASGRAVDKSLTSAMQWYAAAAEQGNSKALFALTEALIADPASPAGQFRQLVSNRLKACAMSGNQLAQYYWGKSLLTGTFGMVDIDKACEWLSAAAKSDWMYIAKELLKKASVWPAARAGEARAGYRLAWLFQELKNHDQAVLWYRKVIDVLERQPVDSDDMFENGSAAKCNLADKYEHGQGVPQDYQQALYWYSQSAAQNNCVAQYSLGNLYLRGLGVPRNVETARQWLRKSAAQGYEDAQKVLDDLPGSP